MYVCGFFVFPTHAIDVKSFNECNLWNYLGLWWCLSGVGSVVIAVDFKITAGECMSQKYKIAIALLDLFAVWLYTILC
jgi:hypothetical protein